MLHVAFLKTKNETPECLKLIISGVRETLFDGITTH